MLYHMGIKHAVSRSTLADANTGCDWRIYGDLAQALISIARPLYRDESFGVVLAHTVYALNATTIDLYLSVFPWASFRSTKAAVRLHTLLDLRGNIRRHAFFVTRAKSYIAYRRRYSHVYEKGTAVRSDQTIEQEGQPALYRSATG